MAYNSPFVGLFKPEGPAPTKLEGYTSPFEKVFSDADRNQTFESVQETAAPEIDLTALKVAAQKNIAEIDRQIEERQAQIKKANEDAAMTGFSSSNSTSPFASGVADQQIGNLASARNTLNTFVNSDDMGQTDFVTDVKDVLKETAQGVFRGENLPFVQAIPQTQDAINAYNLWQKSKTGESLTPDEEAVKQKLLAENLPLKRTAAYSVGKILAQFPAFAAEFAATAGIETTVKAAVQTGVKKVVGEVAKDSAKDYAIRAAGTVIGSFVQSLANVPRLTALTAQYMVPAFSTIENPDGLILEVDKQGDPFPKALAKAIGVNAVDYVTERLGDALEIAEQPAVDALKKTFLAKVAQKKGASFLKDLATKTGWNGVINEVIEEEAAELLQAPIEERKYYNPITTPEGRDRLLAEGIAFGVIGLGYKAADHAAGGYVPPIGEQTTATDETPPAPPAAPVPTEPVEVPSAPVETLDTRDDHIDLFTPEQLRSELATLQGQQDQADEQTQARIAALQTTLTDIENVLAETVAAAQAGQSEATINIVPFGTNAFGFQVQGQTPDGGIQTSSEAIVYKSPLEAAQAGVAALTAFLDAEGKRNSDPQVQQDILALQRDINNKVQEYRETENSRPLRLHLSPAEIAALRKVGLTRQTPRSAFQQAAQRAEQGNVTIFAARTPSAAPMPTPVAPLIRSAEAKFFEAPTQAQVVQQAVAAGPKSIKQVSKETKILEPNVRRILGVGTKEGTFERVASGVYALNINGQTMAYVQPGDAVEELPKLAAQGFKADMVFLDIPYDTRAVKGGNRGVKYDLISTDQFKVVVAAVKTIMRDEDAPVVYMFSNAKSGLKDMQKYTDILLENGLKPLARGSYTKLENDAVTPVRFAGRTMEPEGIIVLNQSGDFKAINTEDLNFKLVRPKGYQTEKPAEMLAKLIKMTTDEGDVVLDPFAGSGVTVAEAVKAGRVGVGIEKNAEVVEKVIKPRVEAAAREAKTQAPAEEQTSFAEAEPGKAPKQTVEEAPAPAETDNLKSIGMYADNIPVMAAEWARTKPIQLPELVQMARELLGKDVGIKKLPRARGIFSYRPGQESIMLNRDIFDDAEAAAKTLAHEIGHLADYLPDRTMKRGNLIGSLFTLNGFMAETFGVKGVENAEYRAELEALSQYWKPYDETADPNYTKYRKNPRELYADFVSVVFNNPGLAEARAPRSFYAFFTNLDNKPPVRDAYFKIQSLLDRGEDFLRGQRREAVQGMFTKGDLKAIDAQKLAEEQRKRAGRNFWQALKQLVITVNEPFETLFKDAKDEDNPTYYLNERNFVGAKVKAWAEKEIAPVLNDLKRNNLSWADLGEILFYERIMKGDRTEVANPLGIQPKYAEDLYGENTDAGWDNSQAKAGMNSLKQSLGEQRFAALQNNAVAFRQALKDLFIKGKEAGIYGPELMRLVETGDFYVPFRPVQYTGQKSSAQVKKKIGTFQDIENPANTTIAKAAAIIKAMEYNRAKRDAIKALQESHPDEVAPAKRVTDGKITKFIEPTDGRKLVLVMDGGKTKGFYVSPYIGISLENDTVGQIAAVNAILKIIRLPNSFFRGAYTTFNFGFQTFNVVRDWWRFWHNVPGMSMAKSFRLYLQAAPHALDKSVGKFNEVINQMESQGILNVSMNDLLAGGDNADTQLDIVSAKIGANLEGKIAKQQKKTMGIMLDTIRAAGDALEALPKVAGYLNFKESDPSMEGMTREQMLKADTMLPAEQRDFIRSKIGSPDFFAKGYATPATNNIFLFSNAIIQGIKSDITIATSPKTAAEWWWKTAKVAFLPRTLLFLAVSGLLGDWLKEWARGVPEYDKTNYDLIPLGVNSDGKSVYVRIPLDETDRFIGAIYWKLLNATKNGISESDLSDLVSIFGGQVPGVTPTFGIPYDAYLFASGQNIRDSFRQRNVFTDQQMKAGFGEKIGPYLKYLWNQAGGHILLDLKYSEGKPATGLEKVLNLPGVSNTLGRWVKITDFGKSEEANAISAKVQSDVAKRQLSEKNTILEKIKGLNGKKLTTFERTRVENEVVKEILGHAPRNAEEKKRADSLKQRFRFYQLRAVGDSNVDAILYAQSNQEKQALLIGVRRDMSDQEYSKFEKMLIQEHVITAKLANDVRRGK